jgi:hypothetical protein
VLIGEESAKLDKLHHMGYWYEDAVLLLLFERKFKV